MTDEPRQPTMDARRALRRWRWAISAISAFGASLWLAHRTTRWIACADEYARTVPAFTVPPDTEVFAGWRDGAPVYRTIHRDTLRDTVTP